MFASSIRIDAGGKADVGAVVFGHDGFGGILEKLCLGSRWQFGFIFEPLLFLGGLEAVGNVLTNAAAMNMHGIILLK